MWKFYSELLVAQLNKTKIHDKVLFETDDAENNAWNPLKLILIGFYVFSLENSLNALEMQFVLMLMDVDDFQSLDTFISTSKDVLVFFFSFCFGLKPID